ncbi:MAG: VirD4-like conjugal transfer protein, CD1115 family [Bacillota bacterium]
MKNANSTWSKAILCMVFLLPVIWAAVLVAQSLSPDFSQFLSNLTASLNNPLDIRWTENTPKCIAIFAVSYLLGIGIYYATRRRYRRLEEHGSAVWGNVQRLCRKYRDKNASRNIILTEHFKLGLNGRKHRRNLNVLVVGGSGSGKTRFYAKPNLMQCNTSFVVTDPKGEILRDTGHLLKARGYDVRVLDLINMHHSYCYNPFVYIQDDKDVLKLVTNIIRNTTPKGASTQEPFWEHAETALLQALMLYLLYEAPPDEQNFPMIMEMIGAAQVKEDDEDYQSPLDELFERLSMRQPEHLAVKQYRIFKLAPGRTAKSILISLGVRLEKFNLPQIAGIMTVDEMDLNSLGDRKTALFALIPDNDTSFNFIVGMLYTQIFQQLYYRADHIYGGRLPVHVHCVMDEWANVALPDSFENVLSTMRSREISVSIIVQNLAQIKALFKDSWESIIGNCDTFLYLGGNEQSTHEYVSKLLGKATIDTNTYTLNRGRSGSYTTNYQQTGRELLTPDEVRLLDNQYALLFLRGQRAMMDMKYDILKHPNVELTTDGGASSYRHGDTRFARKPEEVWLDTDRMEDYEILDDEELMHVLESEKAMEDKEDDQKD